uniref:(northern house mosquito) hypothetical protein n=1 Tax=Culex pipiens TaxID=7175 RepID=A0A8D8GJH6_CULPI
MQNQAEEHHRLHIEKSHSRGPLSNTQEKISSPLTSSPVRSVPSRRRAVNEPSIRPRAGGHCIRRIKPDRGNRRIRTVVSSVTFRNKIGTGHSRGPRWRCRFSLNGCVRWTTTQ